MFTQIRLKNFKIFKEETTFPLSKINLLTGINGRGKSSLLQSMLVLKQTIDDKNSGNDIILNGSSVRLGSFDDVKNSFSQIDEDIEIEFISKQRDVFIKFNYAFTFDENDSRKLRIIGYEASILNKESNFYMLNEDVYGEDFKINNILLRDDKKSKIEVIITDIHEQFKFEDFTDQLMLNYRDINLIQSVAHDDFLPLPISVFTPAVISYISADRIGPKDFYLKENFRNDKIGSKGEFVADVLFSWRNLSVKSQLYLGNDSNDLITQTQEWLSEIFGNAKLKVEDKGDIIYLYFNTKNDNNWYKPSNVGFGYSYILPIIVSGLIAREGEILIVENPEAHLHPRAQSELTKFLAKVASCGVQVFIESHSEHILNALRIAAINPDIQISNEDISVLYFHEKESGYFTQIPILPNGDVQEWPDGFFDQTSKDFKTLFGI